MNKQEPRIGIDIGHVIVTGDDPGADANQAVPGAFDAIARLVPLFGGRVWLVSKCGPRVEGKTRRWLAHHRFFALTGVAEQHLRFCRERPQKRDHALELGLTHFVDDRADVMQHLEGVVAHRFLFRGDWRETEAAIVASLNGG